MRDHLSAKSAAAEEIRKEQLASIQRLETDLITAKQNLAEALNTMHEFEAEHMEYCGVFERQMTFKELTPAKQGSGGSSR